MTTSNEKPIILVVVTFFLALILVYVVYFRVQNAKENSQNPSTTPTVTWSGSQFASTDLWEISGHNEITSGDIVVVDNLSPMEQKIRTITTIKPRYAKISVADELGIDIRYSFSDEWGIQYWYLWTGLNIDLAPVVRRLWWTVLAIQTRNDIMKNLLRWDRILYINIPGTTFVQQWWIEQKLLVVMIVDMGEDRWFIQIPFDQYYAHKEDMKKHFESLYDTVR